MILIDNFEMITEQPAQIKNESGSSEQLVVLDGEEVEFEVEVENYEVYDTI